MTATLLYLFAVVSTLYGPYCFFLGFEGPDIWVMCPLAVASATRAAFHPGPALPHLRSNILAIAWVVGCTLCLVPAASAPKLFLRSLGLFATGAIVVFAAVRIFAAAEALPARSRALHSLALVAMGIVLVVAGAWLMLPRFGLVGVGELVPWLIWVSIACNVGGALAARGSAA